MAVLKLTARGIDGLTTAKPQEDFSDALVPGLAVRVSGTTGRKTWLVRYRAGGRHRRMKLGTYPRMGLAEAREAAREHLQRADAGDDPAAERHQRRSADASFAAMAREVLDAKAATTRGRTQQERERILRKTLIPEWGAMPAGEVTRRDVKMLVERVAKRAPVGANRLLAIVKMLYNEALDAEFPGVESNPATRMRPRPEKGRHRFLEREELCEVWNALEVELPVMKAIFRLALLTGQRIGSVCALRWSDIDDADVWTIPEEAFKGRRPHLVPLSVEALAVLEEVRGLHDECVFPGRADGKLAHVVTTATALRRIRERSGLPHWTVHDFRTTFRTHATRSAAPVDHRDPIGLGVAPHVADAVLGHKEPTLGFARYTGEAERYLLAEKRDALARWGAFVAEAIRTGAERDKT